MRSQSRGIKKGNGRVTRRQPRRRDVVGHLFIGRPIGRATAANRRFFAAAFRETRRQFPDSGVAAIVAETGRTQSSRCRREAPNARLFPPLSLFSLCSPRQLGLYLAILYAAPSPRYATFRTRYSVRSTNCHTSPRATVFRCDSNTASRVSKRELVRL